MANLANERFFPAQPDWVFEALMRALRAMRWSIKSADQYSRSVTFSTPMSGFSWGASLSASVIPLPDGGLVRVGGSAKVRTNVTAGAAERKNVGRLLDAVSRELQEMLTNDPSGAVLAQHQSEERQGDGPAIADQLTQLVELHELGKLSDAEFSAAKAKLLS